MKLIGTPEQIIDAVAFDHPEIDKVFDRVREYIPFIKREILRHEAAVLYMLANDYNLSVSHFLEIGTAWGYSAAVMAEAAPRVHITTLNPKPAEYLQAVENLARYQNVIPLMVHSWDYLALHQYDGIGPTCYDLIFVDGSHDQVERDLPWWDRLRPGGLMLFHDYSPDGSGRPCQQVYDAVNEWQARHSLTPAVLVTDDRGVGMVGYKK